MGRSYKCIVYWGGSYIWRSKESDDLMVAYKVLDDENLVIKEQELIDEFRGHLIEDYLLLIGSEIYLLIYVVNQRILKIIFKNPKNKLQI